MTIELWTIADQVLFDFARIDVGPLPIMIWQTLLAEWLASLALSTLAVLLRVLPWICWSGFAALTAKELALDLSHGGHAWAMLADTNVDLGLPVLAFILTRNLIERIKP